MAMYHELDLNLTPEQKQLRESAHAFAAGVLRPAAAALDRMADPKETIAAGSPMWGALRAAYEQGLHTALVPMHVGGLGLSGLSLHIALEELGWGSADLALAMAVAGYPAFVAAATGDKVLIDEFVKPFVADKQAKMVGCWCLTEPGRGSDQFYLGGPAFRDAKVAGEVKARADGDSFVVEGTKADWISNGTIATHAVVHVALEPKRGIAGGGVALLPLNLPGVSKGPALDKIGQRGLNQGSIVFKGVRVPKRNMVVDAERYEAALDATLAFTNAVMGAVFTGVARAAYEEALARAKAREQAGRPIAEHQLVQRRLFEMYTKVETSRAISRAAMVHNMTAQPPATEASIAAKIYCTQAALEVADSAVQIFGGSGLVKGTLVEKLYRDARAALIEDGSNDVLGLVGAAKILRR